jgi:ubiquinone/menaquinone biosynthesis C-methylase UbiE
MLIPRLMRQFFRWLYHPLAFAYDFVAAAVSLGHWNEWGRIGVLPLLHGTRVLELGHGPGYLQKSLRQRDLRSVGLDESPQMGGLAARRLRRSGHAEVNLVRGLAQSLPFPASSFDTLVSTFPSDYIFDPRTLAEARRVLVTGGKLVVLPAAWPHNPLLGWLFRVTGESPTRVFEILESKIRKPFAEAGFEAEMQILEVESGGLLIVTALSE